MSNISIKYTGSLRTIATHQLSGTTLTTDAPPDNSGEGTSFSPTDLAATALGTCMMTIMAIAAKTHGISMKGAKSTVEKVMASDPRRIGELIIDISLTCSLDSKERKILERAAHSCPVGRRLSLDVKETVNINYI